MFKKTALYISSEFIQQFFGFFNSLLIRRFIIPAEFGIWTTLQIILNYCQYSNLGIFAAVSKEVPFYLGKKDFKKVEEIKGLVWTFILLLSAVIIVGLVLFSFFVRGQHDLAYGLRLAGVMFVLTLIFNYFITLLRAYGEFIALSKIIILNSIIIFVTYVSFSFFWSLYGLLYAVLVSLSIIVFYSLRKHKNITNINFILSLEKFKKIYSLLKTGIGLILGAFCYNLFTTIDKLAVLKLMGFEQLGFYSIAILAFNSICGIPRLISHVVFPEILGMYGRTGKSPDFEHNVQKYVSRPIIYLGYLMPIPIGIICIWGGWVVNTFIPKYSLGINSMIILQLGGFFVGLIEFSYNLIITINKYLLMIPILIAMTLVNILLSFFLFKRGFGIEGIALSASFCYMCFFIIISLIAFKNINKPKAALKVFVHLLVTLLYYSFVLYFLSKIKLSYPLFALIVQSLIFMACCLPFVLKANKETGLFNKLLASFRKKA